MSSVQPSSHDHSPDSSRPDPAFGHGGSVGHLFVELWARLHVCVVQALLRSVTSVLAFDDRLVLRVHANDAWSFARVLANRATIELLMDAITNTPTHLVLTASDQQWSAVPPHVPGALAQTVQLAGPLCAVSPVIANGGAVIASGAPEVVEFDDEALRTRVAESVALARLDRERQRSTCICKFCEDNKRLIVITGARKYDGEETCMGGDLRPALDRRHTVALTVDQQSLAELGHWLSEHLVTTLSRRDPATLLIARGGSFSRHEVQEFRRLAAEPIRHVQALGWEVHIAIGHANLTLSFPGTYEYDVPWDGARQVKMLLDGAEE